MSNETEKNDGSPDNTGIVSETKYGTKLDGTPKSKPGRKATGQVNKTKTIFVYRGNVVGRGKPSLEQVKHRTQVIIPANEVYSEQKHGVGVRLGEDDTRVTEWTNEIAQRESARKAVKVRPIIPVATAPDISAVNNEPQTVEVVPVATQTPGIVEL